MGIKVEFNPDLALRSREKFPTRDSRECIPEPLETGKRYEFLKRGQRNYWLEGEIPLLETKGYERLSRPIASVKIINVTHFVRVDPGIKNTREEVWTKGLYEVVEVFDSNNKQIHFEGYKRVGRK